MAQSNDKAKMNVDRRRFVGMVGLGGAAGMLASSKVLQAAGGSSSRVTGTAVPLPVPLSKNKAQIVSCIGVDASNIAAVRGIVKSTVSPADLTAMSDLLTQARAAYAAGAQSPPPAAVALENQINVYLPGLADQVLTLTGANAARQTSSAVGDPDRDPIDLWSVAHFLSGAAFGALCFDFHDTLLLLIIWEIVEPSLWSTWNESPENIIMDVIIGMLGWYIATLIKEELTEDKDATEKASASAVG